MSGIEKQINELSNKVDSRDRDIARTLVLWEEINGHYQAINEGLDNLQGVPARLERLEEKIDKLDLKMDIIEPVVKDHNARVNRLEQKVFE